MSDSASSASAPVSCDTINWFVRFYGGDKGTYTFVHYYDDYEYLEDMIRVCRTPCKTEAELVVFLLDIWKANGEMYDSDDPDRSLGYSDIDVNRELGTNHNITPLKNAPKALIDELYVALKEKALADPAQFVKKYAPGHPIKEGLIDAAIEADLSHAFDRMPHNYREGVYWRMFQRKMPNLARKIKWDEVEDIDAE